MSHSPSPGAAARLRAIAEANRSGQRIGVTSVCSAHPLVLEAAARQVLLDGSLLLVEATSNQVDQDGGYTGMRPADFAELVYRVCAEVGLSPEQVALGGDHLGPNRWRDLGGVEAMDRAEVLVAAYVEAGFAKIHLDCSMVCAGDPSPIPGTLVAERAARLAKVARKVAVDRSLPLALVIGTEVPVPGGAQETIDTLVPTTPEAVRTTLAEHRAAFTEAGVAEAWDDVLAVVVQPGVEFDHVAVVDYRPDAARELSVALGDMEGLVYEAHSTDYQTPGGLADLVRDHWAVLKVGPGLTFALREALFALAAIEDEVVGPPDRSALVDTLEEVMLDDPKWWRGYYEGDADEQRLARRFSYSDRSRYYWPDPRLETAVERLFANLEQVGVPEPLLSQHLPLQYRRVRAGELVATPRDLVVDHVRDVLRDYASACHPEGATA